MTVPAEIWKCVRCQVVGITSKTNGEYPRDLYDRVTAQHRKYSPDCAQGVLGLPHFDAVLISVNMEDRLLFGPVTHEIGKR